ncbi:DNA-binding IclR family transcriptional regulator [Microbacterium resistens]|uniref:DNA-binding IclR family transcriptional regulator n=1 Tax=Microbacterium resistens TaxID=156977 RepID=A0ABU1SDC1_9MICO|nr:IclR family transcriptional regulator [Microbacterium resistens]MDR6867606.1 DNA-binding IclR family transcriptional regulator [Microbacterium resistens]
MRKTLGRRPPYAVESVDRALQLLQMLRDNGSLRITDASRELGVSVSTAHRLIAMLVYRGFAIQEESRVYVPGPAMGEQPVQPGGGLGFKNVVQPYLERLSAETGETANLMIRVGANVRFLSSVESENILRVGDRRGSVLPARLASGGRALLAELPEAQVRRLYDGELTDGEVDALLGELAQVRRAGFALNSEATETGVHAVGAVVRRGGEDVGAISVSFPSSRLTPALRERVIDALLGVCRDLAAADPA